MRLCFATSKYYPFGGLEKSFFNICREALHRGHALTIYCQAWEGEKLPGARIHEIPLSSLTNHGRLSELHRKVMEMRKQEGADVFVGFKRMPDLDVYYSGDVCFQKEAADKHGPWYRLTPRYRQMLAFEKAVFSPASSTHILSISEREKRIYQAVYGTQEERFHELPAGIDKDRIRGAFERAGRPRARSERGVGDDQLIIITVGSDFRRKGLDRALKALAALPEGDRSRCLLWVIGEGNIPRYRKIAASLGVDRLVDFMGGRSDVPELLTAADILFHPAVAETAGNAILEGLVAGLPVIVSASAGFSYHVSRAQGGIVVDDVPYAQAGFDEALRRLVADAPYRRALGENGWKYADRVDLYRRPQAAMDIIEGVAGST